MMFILLGSCGSGRGSNEHHKTLRTREWSLTLSSLSGSDAYVRGASATFFGLNKAAAEPVCFRTHHDWGSILGNAICCEGSTNITKCVWFKFAVPPRLDETPA
jgi:hypothetical protein